MNRKSKIIVSVVGIAIVLLALLGITYAYYLTRIEGNTNTNSISVTTADLKLVYGDGNGLVTAQDIMPGTVITKTFTVKNDGKTKVDGYAIVLENIVNDLDRTEDLVYTITCKLQDETSCGEKTEIEYPSNVETTLIFKNDIAVGVTQYYTLTVTYKNLTNEDQSDDMGSTFSGRVNIMDGTYFSRSLSTTLIDSANTALANNDEARTIYSNTPLTEPITWPSSVGILGGNITSKESGLNGFDFAYVFYGDSYTIADNGTFTVYNVKKGYNSNYSVFENKVIIAYEEWRENVIVPTFPETVYNLTKIYVVPEGEQDSSSSLMVTEMTVDINYYYVNEKTLTPTEDIYGKSYYYRGSVQDNYIEFNNMCWRIVRIEGDGSTKLILANEGKCNDSSANSGSIKELVVSNSEIDNALKNWFETKFVDNSILDKIKLDKWCGGINQTYRYSYGGELLNDNDVDYDGYFDYFYAAGKRMNNTKKTSLMCENEKLSESKYGLITFDEAALAGASINHYMTAKNYLYENFNSTTWTNSFTKHYRDGEWFENYERSTINNGNLGTMSDSFYFWDDETGGFYESVNELALRPSITLEKNVRIELTGDGTKTNPYIVF